MSDMNRVYSVIVKRHTSFTYFYLSWMRYDFHFGLYHTCVGSTVLPNSCRLPNTVLSKQTSSAIPSTFHNGSLSNVICFDKVQSD